MTVTMTLEEYKELEQYKEKYNELKSCVKINYNTIYTTDSYSIDEKGLEKYFEKHLFNKPISTISFT